MKELMLRLIKDDKIVGEVLFCTFAHALNIGLNIHWYAKPKHGLVRFWRQVGGVWWGCEPMDMPKADSFEVGVKVGDEDWFEGDKGVMIYTLNSPYERTIYGTCIFSFENGFGMAEECKKGKSKSIWDLAREPSQSGNHWRKIGNIHEKK